MHLAEEAAEDSSRATPDTNKSNEKAQTDVKRTGEERRNIESYT